MLSTWFKSFNQPTTVNDAEVIDLILQKGNLFIYQTSKWLYGTSYRSCLVLPPSNQSRQVQVIMLDNHTTVTKIELNTKNILLSSFNGIDPGIVRNRLVQEMRTTYQLEDPRYLKMIFETPWVREEGIESFTSATDMFLSVLSHPTSLNVLDWVFSHEGINWEYKDMENNTLLHLTLTKFFGLKKIIHVMNCVYNTEPGLINQLNTANVSPLELSIQLNKLNLKLFDCFRACKAKLFGLQQNGAYSILLNRFSVGILDTELVVASDCFRSSEWRIYSPISAPEDCRLLQTEEFQFITATEFPLDCQSKVFAFPSPQLISFLISNGVSMNFHFAAQFSCPINLPYFLNKQSDLKLFVDENFNNLLHSSLLSADLHNFNHILDLHGDNDSKINFLTMPNSEGVTPLHILIEKQEYSLITSFMAYKTNNNDNLCHIAMARNDVLLLQVVLRQTKWFDLRNELNDGAKSPLILGIKNKSTESVAYLLGKGCKLELVDNYQQNCLHISIIFFKEEIFTLLLATVVEYDASTQHDVINSRVDGMTPFLLSLMKHRPVAALELIQAGASVGQGQELFPYIVDYYDKSLSLEKLLTTPLGKNNLGSDLNSSLVTSILDMRDDRGNTLLHYSLKQRKLTAFRNILKESPLNVIALLDSKKNHILLTSLNLELKSQCEYIIDEVLEKISSPLCDDFVNHKNANGECSIFLAVFKGYVSVIMGLIKLKASLEVTDDKNNNVFHTLLNQPSSSVVLCTFKFLIEETRLPHLLTQTNDLKENPLHLIVKNSHANIIPFLIQEGILDKFKAPDDGSTLLHYAVVCDSTKQELVIQEILKHKNILNIPDRSGQTPLFYAVIRMKLPIIKLLLEKGPDLAVTDRTGQDILHYAIAGLDQLIFRTVSLAFTQSKLTSSIRYLFGCIIQDNLFALKQLLALIPNINIKDENGSTLLHYIAKYKDRDKMLQLLIVHFDSKYFALRDNEGKTPLHIAIEYGNSKALELMFRNETPPYVRDKWGNTLLHSAVLSNNLDIMTELLELLCATLDRKAFIAYLLIKNSRKLSALHLAIQLKRSDAVQCLLDAGADLLSTSEIGDVSISGGSEDIALNIYSSAVGNPNCFLLYAGYSIDSHDRLFAVSELPDLERAEVKDRHLILPVSSLTEKGLKIILKCPSAEPLRFALKNKLIDPLKYIFKEGNMRDIISEEISLQVSDYLVEISTSEVSGHLKAFSNLANAVTGPIDGLDSQLKLLSQRDAELIDNDEQVIYFKNYVIWKGVIASLGNSTPEALNSLLSYDMVKLDYYHILFKKSLLHYIIKKRKPVSFIRCLLKNIQEIETSCPEKAKLGRDRFINATNSFGKTALHISIEDEQIVILKALLEYSPDITKPDSNRNTPLHLAISTLNVQMVELVIAYTNTQPDPAAILHLKNSNDLTPLHLAVDLASVPVLTCLLANKCSPFLIELCSRNRALDLLDLFLEAGVRLDLRDSHGNTVLHLAVKYSADTSTLHNLIIKFKRERNFCSLLKITNDIGLTPLHAAMKYNNIHAVKMLVSEGAQLITNTVSEFTQKLVFVRIRTDPDILYLGFKLACSHKCIVTALPGLEETKIVENISILNRLSNMKVISICCCESSLPLDLAIYKKYILKDTLVSEDFPVSNLIAKVGSLDVVRLFLTRFDSFNIYHNNSGCMSMIESAVFNQNLSVLEWLLDKLASPAPKSEKLRIIRCLSNSLKLSMENGLIGAFGLLLSNEQVDIYTTYGINNETLLQLMVINHTNCNIISYLMEKITLLEKDERYTGARFIDYRSANGQTALHSSISLKREETVESILTLNPDLSVRDSRGNTVLHLAAQSNRLNIVRMLMTALKNAPGMLQSLLDSPNKISCRPLHLAILTGNFRIVELLLETTCTYSSTRDKFGDTFLHYAVCSGVRHNRLRLVKRLVEFDKDLRCRMRMLNTIDKRGNTPLHLAEAIKCEDIMKYIKTLSNPIDESNVQRMHSCMDKFSSRLVYILAEQTDIGFIPRSVSEELDIKSPFLSTPNSIVSITGCYWCGNSSNEISGLTCSTVCFFLLHSWCSEKVKAFCGVTLCGLPGCSSEVIGGINECCCPAHMKALLAIRGKDLKCRDLKRQLIIGPNWYTDISPIHLEQTPFDEFSNAFQSYVTLDGKTWESIRHFLTSLPQSSIETGQILFPAVLAKFEQNSKLRELLIQTGSRRLVSDDAELVDVLMRVRDSLK